MNCGAARRVVVLDGAPIAGSYPDGAHTSRRNN